MQMQQKEGTFRANLLEMQCAFARFSILLPQL